MIIFLNLLRLYPSLPTPLSPLPLPSFSSTSSYVSTSSFTSYSSYSSSSSSFSSSTSISYFSSSTFLSPPISLSQLPNGARVHSASSCTVFLTKSIASMQINSKKASITGPVGWHFWAINYYTVLCLAIQMSFGWSYKLEFSVEDFPVLPTFLKLSMDEIFYLCVMHLIIGVLPEESPVDVSGEGGAEEVKLFQMTMWLGAQNGW